MTEIEIVTEKQIFTLLFDNRACRLAEEMLGKPLSSLQSISDVTALVVAGLSRHHPTVNMDEADAIIDELGVEQVTALVGEALQQSPPFRRRQRKT